ncbi:MAG: aldo/keto reductase [Bacteroidota bacterium]
MADIILGTVQFGLDYGINNVSGKPGKENVFEILNYAYQSGISTLDTAQAYGDAEEMIGSFHIDTDLSFRINTKFNGVTGQSIENIIEERLKKLNIKNIHTLFYHTYAEYESNPGLLNDIEELKKNKLVDNIGVSVYTNKELEHVINSKAVDTIQLPFNLLDNISQRGFLLQKAKQANKFIQVRSVFLQGLFFRKIELLPAVLHPLKPYLKKLAAIVKETGNSIESLSLQYVNAQPDIDEIIIGVDTKEQLQRNMEVINKPIEKEALEIINNIHVKETELLYPYNWK